MATIKQVKSKLRHKRWAEEIAECQSSGMKINEWCQMKGISCNTYYRRLRIVRNEFLEGSEAPLREIVPLSLVTEQCTAPTVKEVGIVPEESHDHKSEKVIIRKNGIEIKLPQSTEDHMLIALLRGLKEC
ncbi:MAG: IS66 family insertion sequence element accessory protein TnpA [Ruminococcus sp.]